MSNYIAPKGFPRNHGKYWSGAERRKVRRMRRSGYFIHEIAREMGRTQESIQTTLEFPYMRNRRCLTY